MPDVPGGDRFCGTHPVDVARMVHVDGVTYGVGPKFRPVRDNNGLVHKTAWRYDWNINVVFCEDEQVYAMFDYGWRWAIDKDGHDQLVTCVRCLCL